MGDRDSRGSEAHRRSHADGRQDDGESLPQEFCVSQHPFRVMLISTYTRNRDIHVEKNSHTLATRGDVMIQRKYKMERTMERNRTDYGTKRTVFSNTLKQCNTNETDRFWNTFLTRTYHTCIQGRKMWREGQHKPSNCSYLNS